MILSIDAEKTFVKIQHSIPIKALNKLEIERNLLNLIKHIYEKKKKTTANQCTIYLKLVIKLN